jgi:4-hydroxy-tetrahydrodipicolinate reductase
MSKIKLAVAGASGRMGKMLIEAVLASSDFELVGALDRADSPAIGRDAGEGLGKQTGVLVQSDLGLGLAQAQCLIDFTQPGGTLKHLEACASRGVKMVIGTTGFDAAGKVKITEAAQNTSIVFAPNTSIGVNATFKILEVAAKILSEGYDVEVIEAHHHHKIDAPSGTALRMGEVVAKALGHELSEVAEHGREGHTGARKPQTIGFHAIRGGDLVGDHTVMFIGVGERIEITHRSSSRANYAQGALRACRFLMGQKKGLFDMQDVLALK